ncbi:23S rRNA (adenine(2503)-C(2))-methyltransferase RlmN [Dehalogenimonas alkenigignens]|uniref:23S rRNA (adenine(2503)-C(2))-methyltransferase RlmN n=1 Tax=Dehalogenimonas alkenigignens TaxID=1217799 RepID=UPI000D580F97|nr:23S rRNA (adenine(2503)-C(2))-methyltransferase RlmN [Dehalogenimonas alkenigignens]PVV85020.1 23S rRNA (adenine(2503)-C(2))-methyltransferase RlmN [Dehalogenimonas alkenigignens]
MIETIATPLLGLNSLELGSLAEAFGEPTFRGNQMAEWIYRKGIISTGAMRNLPSSLIRRLEEQYCVGRPILLKEQKATDGTFKLLLQLQDKCTVEAVGLPYSGRFSACVSTQVGCPVGCVFCATGLSGFKRNLTAGEIVGQVLELKARAEKPVDHVVFMGMGEPLLNYDATVKSLHLLAQEVGISGRNLTISTSGYIPGMMRLADENLPVTLAVSLHSTDDATRQQLVPGLARWSVAEIVQACTTYVSQTGRRVTFEYCLIDGVNDSILHARKLGVLLKALNCHVNLIPLNPIPDSPFKPSSSFRSSDFQKELLHCGVKVTRRQRKGIEIDAACGQLRRKSIAG